MPLLTTIANPYADALLQVTEARGETDVVAAQAKDVLAIWQGSQELQDAMASPVLEPEAKRDVAVALFADQLAPSFLNLLKLLADRQRIVFLDAVLIRYLDLYRELRSITLARVVSAQPLSADQQTLLNQKVKAIAGSDAVEFDLQVDPSLIGGFIVSMGSQVIDASLSGQVRRLGLALAKAS